VLSQGNRITTCCLLTDATPPPPLGGCSLLFGHRSAFVKEHSDYLALLRDVLAPVIPSPLHYKRIEEPSEHMQLLKEPSHPLLIWGANHYCYLLAKLTTIFTSNISICS
jgi:hypothetical protein